MEKDLLIRSLDDCPLDDFLVVEHWRALDAFATGDERHRAYIERLLEQRDDLDERTFMLAYEGDEIVGRLVGRFLDLMTWSIIEQTVAPGEDADEIDAALLHHLMPSFNTERVRVLATDRDRDARKRRALENAGYSIALSKTLYRRNIAGYSSPYDDPMRYRSLEQTPRGLFEEILVAAHIGDPMEDSSTDEGSALDSYIHLARNAFEARRWHLAELDGVPVGVILPQTYPDLPDEGTLFHIGLVPEYRGRGLGPILHARGLEILGRDVGSYVGSTHAMNAPMIRVFERNGCVHTTTQHFYVP